MTMHANRAGTRNPEALVVGHNAAAIAVKMLTSGEEPGKLWLALISTLPRTQP